MDDQKYQALLQGLKACEINYRAHCSKHGPINQMELNLWQKQLEDLSAYKIAQSFRLHIQNSSFFPTIADVRSAIGNYAHKNSPPDFIRLPAPEYKIPMPQKIKDFIKDHSI